MSRASNAGRKLRLRRSDTRHSTTSTHKNTHDSNWAGMVGKIFETSLLTQLYSCEYPFVVPACIAAAIFFPFSPFLALSVLIGGIFAISPSAQPLVSCFHTTCTSQVSVEYIIPAKLWAFPYLPCCKQSTFLSISLAQLQGLTQSSLLDASLRGHHGRMDHCSGWFSDTVGIRLLKPRRIFKQQTNGFQTRHVPDRGGGFGGYIPFCAQ